MLMRCLQMYPGRDDPFWRDRQQQAAPASAFDLPRLSAGFSTAPLSNVPSLGPLRPAAPLASDVAARAPFYGQSSLTHLSTDPFQRPDALRSYRSMNFDGSAFGPPSMHSNHGSHAVRPFEERQDRRAIASGYGDLLDVRDKSSDLPRGSGSRVNCVCGTSNPRTKQAAITDLDDLRRIRRRLREADRMSALWKTFACCLCHGRWLAFAGIHLQSMFSWKLSQRRYASYRPAWAVGSKRIQDAINKEQWLGLAWSVAATSIVRTAGRPEWSGTSCKP